MYNLYRNKFSRILALIALTGYGSSIRTSIAFCPEFVKSLNDMIVFDAVTCNTDRHFGNFGFLVNNCTNTIAASAPLFDHAISYLILQDWMHLKARMLCRIMQIPCYRVYRCFYRYSKVSND